MPLSSVAEMTVSNLNREFSPTSTVSRNRTISFRLTAEEYDRIHELCYANGIPSISEMARTAINMLLQQPTRASEKGLESRVAQVESRLQMLSLEVKKLNQSARKITSQSAVSAVGPE